MRKGSLILAGLASLVIGFSEINCSSSLICRSPPIVERVQIEKPEKLKEFINYNNIELKKLDDLEFFNENCDEKISLPCDLENMINLYKISQKYNDKEKFKKTLYKKYRLSKSKIKNMSPKEIIIKSADIVADNFTFLLDKNPDRRKFVEEDFNSKSGDCSMYSHFMIYIFNLLKEDSEKLKNIYIGKTVFGKKIMHDWNTIYVLSKDRLQLSTIDVTFYDINKKLDAFDDEHIGKAWKVWFYKSLGDYEEELKQFLIDFKKVRDANEMKLLYREYAFRHYIDNKYGKAIKIYEELGQFYPDMQPTSLYYQGRSYLNLGNVDKGKEILKKLLKKYPKSWWAEVVLKYKLLEK